MKVLVVHDRDEVLTEIAEVLLEAGVDAGDVRTAIDARTARVFLAAEQFDLAVIDLTLSHAQRAEPSYEIAEELLLDVFSSSSAFNLPGDLIGITKEAKAFHNIGTSVGAHLMTIVEEDEGDLWKQQLRDRVDYLLKVQGSRQRSLNRHYDFDVAIVTALDKEFSPFHDIFEFYQIDYFLGAYRFGFRDRHDKIRKGVAFSIGRAGQTSAASAVQAILTQFRPSLCLMSGFCGGFEKKTQIGEVLLAESVVDWDFGKWEGKGNEAVFVPRPEPIGIRDKPIHTLARSFLRRRLKKHDDIAGRVSILSEGRINEIKVSLGPIASGSSVVADPIIISRIKSVNENILGVDMESFALYFSAANTPVTKPEFLMVKAVCDYCDRAKDSKDQDACAYLAARVVEDFLLFEYDFESHR
ncbi:hypothetical protein RFM99_20000 [Mesorhizobium sp. VK4C]|uniref:5'-methylthioadenosine/S-adenosylhomocysteine nucleosidase family protein n=1 Tax=Mesorhizobium captivum TaxID=3072319 RepID=UPI002A24010B|nr:hypothetical protein [Mesorhizobium sp. VK4C]MDX8500690.1 hypothetical protein [Mesorhizobium sp. VK4C]